MTCMVKEKSNKKNGGPDTKNERENRINEVFKLHFEEGKSAVEIAKILDKNRNTINNDIKELYNQLVEEWKSYDSGAWTVRLIHSVDSQKSRLMKELLNQNNFQKRLQIEGFLSKLDDKLFEFIPTVLENKNGEFEPLGSNEISEDQIEKISKYLIFEYEINPESITTDEILSGIINCLKCDVRHARNIFSKMIELGLKIWEIKSSTFQIKFDFSVYYNFLKFSFMRGYLSKDDLYSIQQKYQDPLKEIEEEDDV